MRLLSGRVRIRSHAFGVAANEDHVWIDAASVCDALNVPLATQRARLCDAGYELRRVEAPEFLGVDVDFVAEWLTGLHLDQRDAETRELAASLALLLPAAARRHFGRGASGDRAEPRALGPSLSADCACPGLALIAALMEAYNAKMAVISRRVRLGRATFHRLVEAIDDGLVARRTFARGVEALLCGRWTRVREASKN